MSLVLASVWAEREFDESSRPDRRTVYSWVRNKTIPGRFIGKLAYVDGAAWASLKTSTGDELADSILERLK